MSKVIHREILIHEWQSNGFGLTDSQRKFIFGKSFWITGAGTGYGQAIAIALSLLGAKVFLSGRRLDKLKETVDQVYAFRSTVSNAITIPCDITRADSIIAAIGIIEQHVESLDGVIHCAALPQPACGKWPLMEMSYGQWNLLLTTNVTGAWLILKHALPLLLKSNSQRVIFFTSEAGWADTCGVGAYNVSKAALNNLAMSFSAEIAACYPDKDFQLNVLVPGEAKTEMNQGSDISPYGIIHMTLLLLAQKENGPNGKFFHKDGRHLSFAYANKFDESLI